VSYLCDTAAATLTRYSGYAITTTQNSSAAALAAAGATASLVSKDVGDCQFSYTPGTAQRNALATLSVQLSRNGEIVQLLHEVQMVNSP
jgi:MSHA biogenesis protein MshO